jgi:transposase
LRSLIVVGATAMIRYAREKGPVNARWINALLEKKPPRLVSLAVANKTARIAWVLLVRKEDYRAPMPVERSAQTRQRMEKLFREG